MQETQETWARSLGLKILWWRKWQFTPVLLPGEFHGQRSMAGYSPWVTDSDTTELLIWADAHAYGVVSHCGFDLDLHFLKDWWCWVSFQVCTGHLSIFSGEVSIQVLHHFIRLFAFLSLNCRMSRYILDINPLLDIWFTDIFSQSVGYLFTLWVVSSDAQKV